MDGGAWWAAVHGVAKSRTWVSDFTFTFHFHALEKEMATRSSVLAWRIPGTGEPGGLPSMGSHRVGHDWSNLAAAAYWGTLSKSSHLSRPVSDLENWGVELNRGSFELKKKTTVFWMEDFEASRVKWPAKKAIWGGSRALESQDLHVRHDWATGYAHTYSK